MGGGSGVLGNAVGARAAVAGGQSQRYQRGRISWSATTGAWETIGDVGSRFEALGGVSAFGFPLGGEVYQAGGSRQTFTGGSIWWSPATGAWETFGAIGDRFLALGGAARQGFPQGPERGAPGGSSQSFGRVVIWWSPGSGAWETYGDINRRFLALGGPASFGYPTGGEAAVSGGAVQVFGGGRRIWWSPGSGAWETMGAIGERFVAIGGPDRLGYPLTAETHAAGGGWQWFSRGVVYWSPAYGAWELTGSVANSYVSQSGPYSFYGFPSGAQYAYQGGVRQDFRGGSLLSGVAPVLDATYAPVTSSDVWATWRPGCPVSPASLTLVRLNYWGFDNAVHRGEIIIRSDLAARVASVFGTALADHLPIRSMWRVDYYGGDDPTSMAADNTSGFNCRQVTGGVGLSPHSYGIAVDLNTLENPYYAGRWWPNAQFVDRSNIRPGMLFGYSYTVTAFQRNGFAWGASYLDYQHFEYAG